jgi:hypothetical protein
MEDLRYVRGPGFAAWEVGPVSVGLGLAAHLLSGGGSPPVPVLVALMALLSMCASLAARVRIPSWLLLVLCALAQQVLHLVFDRFAGTFSDTLPAGHQHAAAGWQPGQLTAVLSGVPGHGHGQELLLDTHVAAALLTALLVAKTDRSGARALALLHRAGSGVPLAAPRTKR